jgi:hypothetical protein
MAWRWEVREHHAPGQILDGQALDQGTSEGDFEFEVGRLDGACCLIDGGVIRITCEHLAAGRVDPCLAQDPRPASDIEGRCRRHAGQGGQTHLGRGVATRAEAFAGDLDELSRGTRAVSVLWSVQIPPREQSRFGSRPGRNLISDVYCEWAVCESCSSEIGGGARRAD